MNGIRKEILAGVGIVAMLSATAATFTVDAVKQRYPWNGQVDIDYTVAYANGEAELDPQANRLEAVASDLAATSAPSVRMASFDQLPLPLSAGTHHVTWNAKADGLVEVSDSVQIQLALVKASTAPKYMVVDLSSGANSVRYPVTYLDAEPAGGFNTDEYKTEKIVFKLVAPGSFIMGSPTSEPGREVARESQHPVVLTKPYYLALFELTQGQYRRIAGQQPGHHYAMDERQPLNNVKMNAFRGQAVKTPAATTPLAVLRARTGLALDLPTEAQWEYACRAGTTTPFGNGAACTSTADLATQMNQLGRYNGNVDDPQGVFTTASGDYAAHSALVGSYPPNTWGFYDMHGNVWEATRDLWMADPGATGPAIDPCYGSASKDVSPVAKGGSYAGGADRCRASARTNLNTDFAYHYAGYRLALTLED